MKATIRAILVALIVAVCRSPCMNISPFNKKFAIRVVMSMPFIFLCFSPCQCLHIIGGGDTKKRQNFGVRLLGLGRLADYAFTPTPDKTVNDEDYIDLESGVKTGEVACECYRKNGSPKYVRSANDLNERIAKELEDEGIALKFIPAEREKELKDEGYGLLCIPFEPIKGLKDDGQALKFIPSEAVKVSKDDGCPLKFISIEKLKELKEDGYAYALFIPVETVNKLKDEYNIKMESRGVIEAAVSKSWCKDKFVEYSEYINDYIEIIARPEMGILFTAATMQNIYQLVTSGMVKTGKGKTLMKLNEAAFMMLLYGLFMPRRAAGHVALAIGVALASTAYLVPMSSAF